MGVYRPEVRLERGTVIARDATLPLGSHYLYVVLGLFL